MSIDIKIAPDFDKNTVICLSAVHDLGKLLAQLNGQS